MDVIQKHSIENSQINLIEGNNFSGRSAYLQSMIKPNGTANDKSTKGVMIGEIPSNYISGLAPTVSDEILLHTTRINEIYEKRLKQLLENFMFERHFNKNPFNLSGGEQAVLILICAMLLEPKYLAVDLTIEQLNREWRTPLIQELSNSDFYNTKIEVADNRFHEYGFRVKSNYAYLEENENKKGNISISNIICPPELIFNSKAKNIALINLGFGYSKKNILLQNLNFEFQSGNIYHLDGINGAGKSTLSKILTGVLRPTYGKMYVENCNFNAYRYPGKIVGYSFQNPDEQLFSKTIKDEIIPKEFIKAKKNVDDAQKIIKSFGLSPFMDKHPSEMPFVLRKRIAMAATFANEREWYILDEPTIGQDMENIKELAKLIELFAASGKGIILISHSENFLSLFKNVIKLTLKDGKLIY